MEWLERTELLVQKEGLNKIKKANILIVGLGGVGSFAAEFIARAGVQKMTIVDGDAFDITNKNGIPAYRHTVLSLSDSYLLHKKLEDLVDIGIYECEKYYPSFQQVLFDDIIPQQAVRNINFEVIGRA